MNQTDRLPSGALRRLARGMASLIDEFRYAQRRMIELKLAPDSYVTTSQRAPDTYSEFLYRSSGPLRHEPSARARAAGRHPVR
jgi:hypothetical protein